MKNRLQIKYYWPNFPYTREEAIEYINYIHKYDGENNPNPRVSLRGEPIAVFYGDSPINSNVILAIGRTESQNGDDYFFIDTAKMKEDNEYLSGVTEEVKKVAYQAQSDITELRKSINNINTLIEKLQAEDQTLYNRIAEEVKKIMGGEPVKGLDNLTKIGSTIKTIISKVHNNATDIEKNVERINGIDNRLLDIATKMSDFTDNIHKIIESEKEERDKIYEKIGEIPENLSVSEYIISSLIEAKTYADSLAKNYDAVGSANQAKQDAQSYADSLNAVMNSRVLALEAIDHDHSNKEVLDGITADKVVAWDAAEQNAKDDATLKANNAQNAAQNYTDALAKTIKVKSNDRSINIGYPTSEGTDISVNIDGNTIVRNGDGILSVASDKLVQYRGSNSIDVSEVKDGVKTISLTVNDNDKIITNDVNGLMTTLSLKWVEGTVGGAKDEIQLIGKNDVVISRIDVAKFIKDGILEGVDLLDENGKKILRFTWNIDASNDASQKVTDIDVSELIDVYTAGKGLELIGSEFNIKLSENSDKNEGNEFLSLASDGLKLSGVKEYVQGLIDEVKLDCQENESDIKTIKTNISNIEGNITTITSGLTETNNRVGNLETVSHTHSNKVVIDTITEDKVTAWSNSLSEAKTYADDKDKNVKKDVYNSFISTIVTNVTPEDATSQTLIRTIGEGENPKFYVSNSSRDMFHNGDSLYNVIETLKENEELKGKVQVLESKVVTLEGQIASLQTSIDLIINRLDNINLKVDMEEIKTAVVPVAVQQAKEEIISGDVFKAIDGEIKVSVDNGTITYGFDDNAVFMAEFNPSLNDE